MSKTIIFLAIILMSTISLGSPLNSICKKYEKLIDKAQDGGDLYAALESQILEPLELSGFKTYAKGLRNSIIINGDKMFDEVSECKKIKILDSCLDGIKVVEKFKSKGSLTSHIYNNIVEVYLLEELRSIGLKELAQDYYTFTQISLTQKTCRNLSEDIHIEL